MHLGISKSVIEVVEMSESVAVNEVVKRVQYLYIPVHAKHLAPKSLEKGNEEIQREHNFDHQQHDRIVLEKVSHVTATNCCVTRHSTQGVTRVNAEQGMML